VKQQVSPVFAAVLILAVVGLAALGWVRFAGVSKENTPPPTMPPEVAKQWGKYTNGAAAGRGASGSIPSGQSGPTVAPPTGGGSVGAPQGITGGYGMQAGQAATTASPAGGPPPGITGGYGR
jgi:hypothetical protein